MKSLIRWGATLGLVGGTLLGAVSPPAPALALSEDEIMQKLASVPVFAITDAEGSPLIASVSNPQSANGTTEVAGVFMNPQDANRFVERLTQEQPEMAGEVQVTVISLAEVYRLEQSHRQQESSIEFSYVPTRQEVESAVSVLLDSGREDELLQQNGEYVYPGVPLFMATAGPDQGYMTVEFDGEVVIPLFFDREDLENVIARFQQQQPDFAATVQTDVVQLEGVLETLRNEDNDVVGQLMFVPHSESLEFVGNMMQQMQQQQQQQQPQLQPGEGAPALPGSGR
ncbi:Tic22 family protein [Sodalinema gerasimenkoae]|uniref:Tic22 family protein n=1 Tax=Sodalinema gerasimenkoae TaxID=2862348 RepID=UPI00135A4770|nr:Tic22 family protein [Sodalinema gerasimenkoae]